MTIPQETVSATPTPTAGTGSGRGLASAIAVFLGGYLLLAAFEGTQLTGVALNLFSEIVGRPGVQIPAAFAVVLVLQFVFAIVVVVAGLLLGRGPITGRIIGAVVVVAGSLLLFVVFGARFSGLIRFPSGEVGLPFQMLFANAWFGIVLIVGVAWLLARGARLGWLSLLPALILIPLPVVFALNSIENAVTMLMLYPLSALIGAGIIAAGRPLRD